MEVHIVSEYIYSGILYELLYSSSVKESKSQSLKTRDFEKWGMQVQGPFWAQAVPPGPVFLPQSAHQFSGQYVSGPFLGLRHEYQCVVDWWCKWLEIINDFSALFMILHFLVSINVSNEKELYEPFGTRSGEFYLCMQSTLCLGPGSREKGAGAAADRGAPVLQSHGHIGELSGLCNKACVHARVSIWESVYEHTYMKLD